MRPPESPDSYCVEWVATVSNRVLLIKSQEHHLNACDPGGNFAKRGLLSSCFAQAQWLVEAATTTLSGPAIRFLGLVSRPTGNRTLLS